HVVAVAADDRIVEGVAGAVDSVGIVQVQVLEIVSERVGDAAGDRVGAAVGALDDLVAGIIDHIVIAAATPGHAVRARTAIQEFAAPIAGERVVAGVTEEEAPSGAGGDLVGKIVALAPDVGGERQILDVVRERVGDRGIDLVGSLARILDDDVAEAVDDIGVVARAAGRLVVAALAVEGVGGGVADEEVLAVVAGGVEWCGGGERDV